ncbi:MAG: tRNA (adenosine(37)-N6)-threonylcarbamoyltransferase complex ATPase subunit type 1 TsaE [Bacteroidales bacterium]|nr:tRNA (adenosine(37)-N6)-threonylcarbamoyltransferase complex ATPase subunit type 1 TsaE [Bacteroidales bacterium]
MQTFKISSPDQMAEAAKTFLFIVQGFRTFAFYGPMGSGKTTLIKAICGELGATDVVTSPTFALVNEYHTRQGEILYHLDLYRINSISELYDFGYEEYFYNNHYIFIEWADKAEALLPDDTVKVILTETGVNSRLVQITF